MALVDDFKARFPEFPASVVDQRIAVLEAVWPAYYGGSYDDVPLGREAALLVIAHLMALGVKQGKAGGAGTASSGSVQSKSVGSVSVSYAASNDTSDNRDFFGTTSYGQMFLMLIAGGKGAVFV